MALSAGAGIDAMDVVQIAPTAYGKMLGAAVQGAGIQPNLWLNSRCVRFTGEDVVKSFALAGNELGKLDDGIAYSIFDADILDHMEADGSDIGLGDFQVLHKPMETLKAEMTVSLEEKDGAVFKADTLEELAAQINYDSGQFVAQVESYNAKCDAGFDDEFFKAEDLLRPIRKAPFYAIRLAPCILCTDGGIRVNGDMQVTDDKYNPIDNLYAVGNEASGLFGDVYNLDCPGTTNGFAHTSGRIAARAAIKAIQG